MWCYIGKPISKQEKQTVGIVAKLIEKSPIAGFAITDVNETEKEKKKIRHCGEFIKKFHLFFFIYVIEPRVRKCGNGGNKSNRAINSMEIKYFNDVFIFQSYFSISLPSFS